MMVTETVDGLPATVFPVIGSIALIVTLVVYVEPPVKPVAFTSTLIVVLVPPTRLVPDATESETKFGAFAGRAAVQFKDPPPVLPIVTGWEFAPVETLKVSGPGPVVSAGGASTFNVTATVCGLPVIATPLSTAASEIEPVYVPAASAADVTVTVKVALLPLATFAEAGDTASQPVPFPIVTVGVIFTVPTQDPITPIVKFCTGGFELTAVEKVSAGTGGFCSVQEGCTVNVTVIVCGVPTGF